MRNVFDSKQILPGSVTLLLCLIMAAPAMAQRPSLGGLQSQIDTVEAKADANEAKGLANMDDNDVTMDGVCTVAIAAGVCEDVPFCTCPKTVFVTSTVHNGNLGGLAGADAICQARANEAGLDGTYTAFLSSTAEDARDRLTTSDGGYIRTDRVQIAVDTNDLLNGDIVNPINIDENGQVATGQTAVYTGSRDNGTLLNSGTCNNWISDVNTGSDQPIVGLRNQTNASWTFAAQFRCNAALHLYCFED